MKYASESAIATAGKRRANGQSANTNKNRRYEPINRISLRVTNSNELVVTNSLVDPVFQSGGSVLKTI